MKNWIRNSLFFIPISYKKYCTLTIPISLFITLVCTFAITNVNAQEIDFETYSSYSVTVSELNPAENLSFGNVIVNEGTKNIDLSEAKILSIEGVKYLDIFVLVEAGNYLLLNGDSNCEGDPSCSIPFTLKAAYANRGSNNINHAVLMTVTSNTASAQFPILARPNNQPAGPPPTPVYEGYNPAAYNETAYLYLYGSINVGNVDAGSYSGNITITVSYD